MKKNLLFPFIHKHSMTTMMVVAEDYAEGLALFCQLVSCPEDWRCEDEDGEIINIGEV